MLAFYTPYLLIRAVASPACIHFSDCIVFVIRLGFNKVFFVIYFLNMPISFSYFFPLLHPYILHQLHLLHIIHRRFIRFVYIVWLIQEVWPMSKVETETKQYRNIRLSMDTYNELDKYANELSVKEKTRNISLDHAVSTLLKEHFSGR